MFHGIDFLNIDSDLSDEEELARDSAREFVEKEVLPEISTHFEEETFPTKLIKRMGELEFLGANIHGYGCSELNNVAYGLINQELERGDKYVLNGSKMWISNGSIADIAVVWAKLYGIVRRFIVPKDMKGFSSNSYKA